MTKPTVLFQEHQAYMQLELIRYIYKFIETSITAFHTM